MQLSATRSLRSSRTNPDFDAPAGQRDDRAERGDGIARVYGLESALAASSSSFRAACTAWCSTGARQRRHRGARRGHAGPRRRHRQAHGRIAEVPVGDAVIGRVVNALGQPIAQGTDRVQASPRIEIKAPGIIAVSP